MIPFPCPVCGYDAEALPCPHCGDEPLEESLRGEPAGPGRGVQEGVVALYHGARTLVRTRGTKRWLVPPLVLTFGVFLTVFLWAWLGLRGLLSEHLSGDVELSSWDPSWYRTAVEWVLNEGFVLWVLRHASALAFVLVSSMIAWFCFSIAYEAFAGPFLDEVHGRVEERWFGCDPRARLQRPNEIPARRCVRHSALAAGAGLVLVVAGWFAIGAWALLLFALPFLTASRLDREYGAWLRWFLRIEARALWIGIEVSILCGVLLVLFLPLYLVPAVGPGLYAVAAGACTAVSLIDLPLERRGWSLRERARFVRRHALGLTAFGTITGFVFAVPLLGPVVAVPCASVGALWLVVRLDKVGVRRA